jgi:hypothetical protein
VKQTKFLFDKPVTKDWLFWVFVTLGALNGIAALQRVNEGGGVNTSTFSLVSGTIDALFVIFSTYILVIPIYLIRRFIRNKNKVEADSSVDSSQLVNDANRVDTSGAPKKKSKKPLILVGVAVLVLFLIGSIGGDSSSEGDRYFEIQQNVSAVVNDWNVAATPLAEAITAISEGSMGAADARGVIGEASSKFAVIANQLDDACASIPSYDVNASGEDGAIAKAYDALQVTCNLLPQQSTEALLLVNEQISPEGTQERIDYHASQISIIAEKRKQAVLDSLDALIPFLTDAQKANAERMREALTR